MLFSHVKISSFHQKLTWYFIGVYIINIIILPTYNLMCQPRQEQSSKQSTMSWYRLMWAFALGEKPYERKIQKNGKPFNLYFYLVTDEKNSIYLPNTAILKKQPSYDRTEVCVSESYMLLFNILFYPCFKFLQTLSYISVPKNKGKKT